MNANYWVRGLGGLVVLGLVVLLGNVPSALGDTVCPPNLSNTTVSDNLTVDGICVITNVTVEGDVKVESNGDFTSFNSTIEGSLQADGGVRVIVDNGSRITGDAQLKKLTGTLAGGGFGSNDLSNSTIDGNLQIEENEVRSRVSNMFIGGDLQMFKNTSVQGSPPEIFTNTIGGNLQCKENNPAPIGGNNMVSGNREDQCAGF